MASLADLASGSPTPPPPRACARAREPTVTWETCHRKCRTCVALPKVQRGVQTWRPCPRGVREMASNCGVICPHGLREPGGVAKRDVKMWRHLPTWRQGARWRRRTWRQNVASLAHVASGSVAGRGVKMWRHLPTASGSGVAGRGLKPWRHWLTWRTCGVTGPRGVREPGGVAGRGVKMWRHLPTWRQGAKLAVASLGVAERGVKTWRHLPTWRQGATWRRRTWRQNVASGAMDLRGVTGRGVKTWRHEARPPGTCLQNVSSVVGRYVDPHRRPPCLNHSSESRRSEGTAWNPPSVGGQRQRVLQHPGLCQH